MHPILEQIQAIGIVPVIKIDDADKAVPLARALIDGGIPCAEITLRTAQGEEAIRRIHNAGHDILLGAGTVLTTAQADRALDAGAQFIVSPGLNPAVARHCIARGAPFTPGCATPSDLEKAMELELDVVKFFPAEQAGGLAYIKAVAAPYPGLRFMPTGGIHGGNIAEYLAFDKVIACGGSWMAGADLIRAGDFDAVTAACRQAVRSVLDFRMAHVGIHTENREMALEAARLLAALFGFPVQEGNSSVFADTGIELTGVAGIGEHGHIAISVNSVERAMDHLRRRGVAFREDTAKTDAAGRLKAVYLQPEIAGFAIHLLRR